MRNDFYWLPDFNNIRDQLFPDHQCYLYFLMNIEITRLQQSIKFNIIATCNKHLFIIILKIHMFAILNRASDIFIKHLLCFGIKIVKQCLFSTFTPIFC